MKLLIDKSSVEEIKNFSDLIIFCEFKNDKNVDKPENIISTSANFMNVFEFIKEVDFEKYQKLRSEISDYLLDDKNDNVLYYMTCVIFYSEKIDNRVLEKIQQLYDDALNFDNKKILEDKRLSMCSCILTVAIYESINTEITDNRIKELIDMSIVKNFLLYHTVKSTVADKPHSTIDFKRAMLKVFRNDEKFQPETIFSNLTRAKMFKLLANYLYDFDREFGERILAGEFFTDNRLSWNDEIKLITDIFEKIENNNKESNAFIDDAVLKMILNLPVALSDKIDSNRFNATIEDSFEYIDGSIRPVEKYNYASNHANYMVYALRYYVHEMNPEIRNKLCSSEKV